MPQARQSKRWKLGPSAAPLATLRRITPSCWQRMLVSFKMSHKGFSWFHPNLRSSSPKCLDRGGVVASQHVQRLSNELPMKTILTIDSSRQVPVSQYSKHKLKKHVASLQPLTRSPIPSIWASFFWRPSPASAIAEFSNQSGIHQAKVWTPGASAGHQAMPNMAEDSLASS